MSLKSNTTVTVTGDETTLGHQNSTCIFVDSNAARICVYCLILLGSFFGKSFIIIIVYKQLFHREHGCVRSAFPSGCNS